MGHTPSHKAAGEGPHEKIESRMGKGRDLSSHPGKKDSSVHQHLVVAFGDPEATSQWIPIWAKLKASL